MKPHVSKIFPEENQTAYQDLMYIYFYHVEHIV